MTSYNRFAQELFTGLPARYEVLAEILSFGQNARWRKTLVDPIASAQPGCILDVATGPCGVALQLARRTEAHVVGLDITLAMLRRGQERVQHCGLENRIDLVLGRGEQLPFADGTFDALTFTYLLRYVDEPAATVAELARVVRAGGTVASVEFFVPPNRIARALWVLYTRAVLPVLGFIFGGTEWWKVGRFLGPSISRHCARNPLERNVELWEAAGIRDVSVRPMSFGSGLVMWGTRDG